MIFFCGLCVAHKSNKINKMKKIISLLLLVVLFLLHVMNIKTLKNDDVTMKFEMGTKLKLGNTQKRYIARTSAPAYGGETSG
jgi:outer membrane protein assembly factor BamD